MLINTMVLSVANNCNLQGFVYIYKFIIELPTELEMKSPIDNSVELPPLER